jgi:hypothetical protein
MRMRIPFVVAVASPSSPQHHESEESQKYGDDCWSGGMAHSVFLSYVSGLENVWTKWKLDATGSENRANLHVSIS